MDAADRLGVATRRLVWLEGEPDARILQLWFTLLLSAEVGLRAAVGISLSLGDGLLRAVALSGILTGVAVCLPARRRRALLPLLAVLDLGLIGLARLSEGDAGVGLLVVLPALWLGRRYGWRGAFASAGASLVLITAPGILTWAGGDEGLTYLAMIPVIAGVSSLAIAAGLDAARAALQHAERDERRLLRALETIKAQQTTSQAVFDAVDVGLMLLDRDGAELGMNQKYAEFVTLSTPEHGQPCCPGDAFAADGVTRLRADDLPSSRAARGEEFDDFRMWAGADPSTRRAVSISARRAENETGGFIGAALAGTDITDLMRAIEVQDQFVASVSHELRTPLTSIFGYVNILLDEPDLPDRVRRQLAVVARNAERLRCLVADLLQESQHADGTIALDIAPADVGAIVRQSVLSAFPAAELSGVDLELVAPESVWVDVDGQRLAQAVDNLISNAIKYTGAGGRAVVTLRAGDAGVELIVADTGYGIGEADREKLFTRFFRTKEATQRAIQGVGLGLSITKAIVESHGGRIEVDSELGRGSEFRISLPTVSCSPGRSRRSPGCG